MVEISGEGEDDPFDDAFVPNTTPIDAPIAAKTKTPAMMGNHSNGNPQTRLPLFFMGLCGFVF